MKKVLLILLLPLTLFGQSQKISDMTSATSLTGSEYVPIVQTTNKKSTVTLLRGWASTIGTAGQLMKVNAGATALEFFTPTYLTSVGTGVANELTYWSGTSTLGSLATATYPSLTELSYIKGVTSAVQTQLGTKISLSGTQNLTGAKVIGGAYDLELGTTGNELTALKGRATTVDLTGTQAGFTSSLYLATSGYLRNGNYALEFDPTQIRITNTTSHKLEFDATGAILNLGATNATGDIYYRNSSGYLTRLPVGTNTHVLTLSGGLPSWAAPSGGGGTWGSITGTLSSQTDLQNALDARWSLANGGTLTGAIDIVGTSSNTIKHSFASLGTTRTDGAGIHLRNTTAAAAGAQQISPSIVWEGQGWKTNATAASQSVIFRADVLPLQGAANPTGTWELASEINGGGKTTRLSVTSAGLTTTGDLTLSSGNLTISSSRIILFNGGLGSLRANTNAGLEFRTNASTTVPTGGYYRFYNGNGNYSATSGTLNIIANETGFAPTSGTAVFNAYLGSGTINQTGGANGVVSMLKLTPTYTAADGDVNALYYDPTVTSVVGVNYFLHATSGKTLIGGTTITSNTFHDLRGGSSTDKILRLADGSNNELFTFKADKEYEVTQTNGKYQERQPTGTTSATVYSENIYSSSDISDGQSVTIEVLWTAKGSGANTGAGGIFYTTWTKASGTLAKAGDNQLVTNDNMTGSWALSTSDSSGSIALAFTGTGVANSEISLVTRIIKSN